MSYPHIQPFCYNYSADRYILFMCLLKRQKEIIAFAGFTNLWPTAGRSLLVNAKLLSSSVTSCRACSNQERGEVRTSIMRPIHHINMWLTWVGVLRMVEKEGKVNSFTQMPTRNFLLGLNNYCGSFQYSHKSSRQFKCDAYSYYNWSITNRSDNLSQCVKSKNFAFF